MDYAFAAPLDITVGYLLLNQLDGVTDLNAPTERYRPNRCRSKNGICPQCYLNNIIRCVDDLKEDTEKLLGRLTGELNQCEAFTSQQANIHSQYATKNASQTSEKNESKTQTVSRKTVRIAVLVNNVDVREELMCCKNNGICPQCFLKQISTTEDELFLLRKAIDESVMKTISSKTGLEINELRNRLTLLEEEVKRFKKILLEALNRIELRNDCWIARKTHTATKSTVEFIRNLLCIPRIFTNTGEIDGLNHQ